MKNIKNLSPMIINPYSGAGGSGISYSTEYTSVLNTGISLSYLLPSVAQRTKQNQLILTLISSGIWNLLDTLYIFSTDGDSNFATLNWKSPGSFQVTKVNSPTFTSNQGFKGNAISSYLNTNWIPNTNGVNYTQNDAGTGAYNFENLSNANTFLFGSDSTTTTIYLISKRASDGNSQWLINSVNSGSGSISNNEIGLLHISRSGTTISLFKNGSSIATATNASVGKPTVSMFGLARNTTGTANGFSNRTLSVLFAGSALASKESALYTAINTYLT